VALGLRPKPPSPFTLLRQGCSTGGNLLELPDLFIHGREIAIGWPYEVV